ncbi:Structural maintenance of chromosomes protein 3 [Trichinella pseudospiralis]|uniref:Structural maintenance of chromosomes protein 3 n=1 Tax=Trichinella pseudospiralis TaxID=6337 RepID=A0A0V1KA40_TRIPS|nr:Structural maintenance of chromosomes protein 3 [Trichinella pseudospiralis]
MEKELFYQIAENDGIVTTFLEEISCQRLPDEVNFFPLNRIQYSQTVENFLVHIADNINQLQFEERFIVALRHCFQTSLIGRNMDAHSNTNVSL